MPSFVSTESARSSSEPEATDLPLRRRNNTTLLATHLKARCESADDARRSSPPAPSSLSDALGGGRKQMTIRGVVPWRTHPRSDSPRTCGRAMKVASTAKPRYNEVSVAVILRVARVVAASMGPRVRQAVPGGGKARIPQEGCAGVCPSTASRLMGGIQNRDPAQLVEPEPAGRKAAPQACPH
jgi:hypothetical protein